MRNDRDELNAAHKRLDGLIELTEKRRVKACKEGNTDLRDKLERVGAHLRMARAEAGSLDFGGIRPLSGDK